MLSLAVSMFTNLLFQLFYLERTKNFHFRNKTNSTFNKTNSDSSGEISNLTKFKIYCTLRGTRSRLEEIWWLTISQIIDETKSANRTKDFFVQFIYSTVQWTLKSATNPATQKACFSKLDCSIVCNVRWNQNETHNPAKCITSS